MRIDGDGNAIYELTVLLTPKEAQEAVGVLQQLLRIVPSEQPVSENEIDDAPSDYVGGTRTLRLVVYADHEEERLHDTKFGTG